MIKDAAFICCLLIWVLGLGWLVLVTRQQVGFILGVSVVVGSQLLLWLFTK
jgi:hypothetical protein